MKKGKPILQRSVAIQILCAGSLRVQKQLKLSAAFMEVSESSGPLSTGCSRCCPIVEWQLSTDLGRHNGLACIWLLTLVFSAITQAERICCDVGSGGFGEVGSRVDFIKHDYTRSSVYKCPEWENWTPVVSSAHVITLRTLAHQWKALSCSCISVYCGLLCGVGFQLESSIYVKCIYATFILPVHIQ